jgi:hypothetical protein
MAGQYDITIDQGATWTLALTYKDGEGAVVDLSGYTAKMQIRPFARSSKVILERSTEAETIVLGGAAGTVSVTATAAETGALKPGVGVYDLELYSPIATTIRLLQGDVTISAGVTR